MKGFARNSFNRGKSLQAATFALGFLLLISLPGAFGQTGGQASLYGTVKDPTGAVIPGAHITVTNVGTGVSHITVSNSNGNFVFPVLPIGQYRLDVQQTGFAHFEAIGLTVVEAQNTRANVVLQVGTAKQAVTVSAGTPLVDTQSQGLEGTVYRGMIDELPLIDRNVTTLETIQAGTSSQTTGYGTTLTTNGVRSGHNEYMLDGVAIDNPQFTIIETDPTYPSPDAVQEFTLITNGYEAQYGRNEGAQVIVATRSGTDQFHGLAYDYLRNNALDANSLFANEEHSAITPYKRNIFGGTFGGPIRKHKLFFFSSYMGTRAVSTPSAAVQNVVPTQTERDGDFSSLSQPIIDPTTGLQFPGNIIPTARLSSMDQKLLSLVPLPNGPGGELIYAPASTDNDNQYVDKIDYMPEAIDHLYGSIYIDRPNEVTNEGLPAINNTLELHHTVGGIHEMHDFRANMLNDFSFGGIYYQYEEVPDVAGNPSMATFGATYDIPPGIDGKTMLFTHIIGNMSMIGGDPSLRNGQLVQAADNFSWIKGNHDFLFGGIGVKEKTWTLTQLRRGGEYEFNGYATGNAIADYMIGLPSYFEQDGGIFADRDGQDYAAYAQDTWRARHNLTLNYGLRWAPTFYEDQKGEDNSNLIIGEQSNIFPTAPRDLVYQGDPGVPADGAYHTPYYDVFEPRVGLAWTPFGHLNWVLRSSFAELHEPPDEFVVDNNFSPPFTYNAAYDTPIPVTDSPNAMNNPYEARGVPDPFPFTPVLVNAPLSQREALNFTSLEPLSLGDFIDPSAKVPVSLQWNFAIQHQVAKNDGIEVAYVGDRSYRELYDTDPALAIYIPGMCNGSPCSTEENIQSRRLLGPAFTQSYLMVPTGYSDYNALEITYLHRINYGLSVNANYTWAKAMDDGQDANEDIYQIHDPFNLRDSWGPAGYDQANIANISYVWRLPWLASGHGVWGDLARGWTTSGIASAYTGFPQTVLSGVDNSLSGEGYDYADVVPEIGWRLSGGRSRAQEIQQWFNPKAFTVNAIGTWGNSAPGTVWGPGGFTWDMSFFRDFHIGEHIVLQYRLDGSNMLNHPVLTNLSTTYTASNFGAATATGNPRLLQMALRLLF